MPLFAFFSVPYLVAMLFQPAQSRDGAAMDGKGVVLAMARRNCHLADRALFGKEEEAMKLRPILFSAPMVRALLDGRKTQTRRALKRQFLDVLPLTDGSAWIGLIQRETAETASQGQAFRCKFGLPGDTLWVRETWQSEMVPGHERDGPIRYRATQDERCMGKRWVPGIHMPRWASRITLRITEVRCERLNDISPEDAAAEGWPGSDEHSSIVSAYPIGWYANLWETINGKSSWDLNPFVWAVSFERTK